MSAVIKRERATPVIRNPYRAVLKRDYPEPFIALLLFFLGVWLWDHYFGKTQGYAPGTEQIALVKIDRDLRLSDAMKDDPAWLRFIAGVEAPEGQRDQSVEVFGKLAKAGPVTPSTLEAFAIVRAVQDELPVQTVVGKVLQDRMISDFHETSHALASHGGTWWHAQLVSAWEKERTPAVDWRPAYQEEQARLRTRVIWGRSLVFLIGGIGLVFLPRTIRGLVKTKGLGSKGYAGAWTLPLGLVVYLVATLAWIGFNLTLEVGAASLPGLHPALILLLDSVARVMPALIALALLFRHPPHAIRVMGMNRSVDWTGMLGAFSLLMIVEMLLSRMAGNPSAAEPGGGLSFMDAGGWGLISAVVSACILAPVVEEILYRGILFRSFQNRIGVFPSAILSSAIFAVLHFYSGYGLISVGIFGLVSALLYARTGSLATVIALHMLYNAAIKIPDWLIYHAPLG